MLPLRPGVAVRADTEGARVPPARIAAAPIGRRTRNTARRPATGTKDSILARRGSCAIASGGTAAGGSLGGGSEVAGAGVSVVSGDCAVAVSPSGGEVAGTTKVGGGSTVAAGASGEVREAALSLALQE